MKNTLCYSVLCISLLMEACGKDNDAGDVVDNFIPEISNAWQDQHSQSVYILSADSANVPKGTFTGERQNPDSTDTPQLTGSFVHEKIQFTFTSGNPQGITYKGMIDTLHPKEMRLINISRSPHDSLYLIRP